MSKPLTLENLIRAADDLAETANKAADDLMCANKLHPEEIAADPAAKERVAKLIKLLHEYKFQRFQWKKQHSGVMTELRLICGPTSSADQFLGKLELPLVASCGEVFNFNGYPYIVQERSWSVGEEGLFCYLRVVKHH